MDNGVDVCIHIYIFTHIYIIHIYVIARLHCKIEIARLSTLTLYISLGEE